MSRDTGGPPARSGPPPYTTPTNPHQQLDQNAPAELQEKLYGWARALPDATAFAADTMPEVSNRYKLVNAWP
jgi:hypothetical protein